MTPWYRGHSTCVKEVEDALPSRAFATSGRVELDRKRRRLLVLELPVGTWTKPYKESTLARMVDSGLVTQIDEHHTEERVHFELVLCAGATLGRLAAAGAPTIKAVAAELLALLDGTPPGGCKDGSASGRGTRAATRSKFANTPVPLTAAAAPTAWKALAMEKAIRLNNMHLFGSDSCIEHFASTAEVFHVHAKVRCDAYVRRKAHLIEQTEAEQRRADERARFIDLVVSGTVRVKEMKRAPLLSCLRNDHSFTTSPAPEELLEMGIGHLTTDQAAKLRKRARSLQTQAAKLRRRTVQTMWLDDLAALRRVLDTQSELHGGGN